MGLPSPHRMTRTGEYASVRQHGKARSGRLMTLAWWRGDSLRPVSPGHIRFGFTITKRVGNAVNRNLLKRRFREIARAAFPAIQQGGMLVTIPRPCAKEATFQELEKEWRYLAGKMQLL